jgi:lysophospholipase L1-like esterase
MDPCVMAAQLLAQCATVPSEPSVPDDALPAEVSIDEVTDARAVPAAIPANPEIVAELEARCTAWDMPGKPKFTPCASAAITPSTPASLPLHSDVAETSETSTLEAPWVPHPAAPVEPGATSQSQQSMPGRTPMPAGTLHQASVPYPRVPQVGRASTVGGTPATSWNLGPQPTNGSQFYHFRLASLQAGEMYTRTSPRRYISQWQPATGGVTYGQWQSLLAREAAVMAQSQGNNRLTVVVGDSLGLWLPAEYLPRNRFWLNQSISGETTGQILRRLHYFDAARPDKIHVMAGINDLKNGASDDEIVRNMRQILIHLRQQHPQAQIVVHSILPTRLGNLPTDRISRVNGYIAYIANQQGATFVDLQPEFADSYGQLRRELTTDGLHLSFQGYQVWQATLLSY